MEPRSPAHSPRAPARFQVWAQFSPRSCSASRLQICVPTTCSELRSRQRVGGAEKREGGVGGRRKEAAYTRLPVSLLRAARSAAVAAVAVPAAALAATTAAHLRRPPGPAAPCCHPWLFLPITGFLRTLPLPSSLLSQEKGNNRPAKKNHIHLAELLKCLPGRERVAGPRRSSEGAKG